MLEEKLKQANIVAARRSKLIITTVALTIFFGVVVVAFFVVDFGVELKVSERDAPSQVASPVAEAKNPTPAKAEISSPVEKVDSRPINMEEEQTKLRQEVLERLRNYEEDLKPKIHASNLQAWDHQMNSEIATLEDAAKEFFSYSEYGSAIENLDKLENSVKDTLEKRDEIYSSNYKAALKSLTADNYIEGKLHISKALLVKPNDQVGLELEHKIDALPKILKLLKEANVARIENNLDKEFALIKKAYSLDQERKELQQRAARLGEAIKEQKFTTYVTHSQNSVEENNLSSANSFYNKARSIFSKRPELSLLQKSIAALERAEDLKRSMAVSKKAAERDNWREAQKLYQSALKRHPNDNKLQSGLQLSTAIVDLQDGITGHLERPDRLSSPNIFRLAKDILLKAKVLSRNSKSLAESSTKLNQVLEQMNKKVPITVISDNKTSVRVKGVGNVGIVSKKTIHLRPGEYFFEGARRGFRSKIIKVKILIGAQSSTVEIMCDEPI